MRCLTRLVMLILVFLVTAYQTTAIQAKTLKIGVQGTLASLDPHILNETFTLGILSNMMEGLVRRDALLRLQPGLATRWQRLTPLHWRFHLRRGVYFHDGSSFTADDVVFSFERARQPLSQQQVRIPTGARIVKIDPHTVDIHLIKPHPTLHADWEALLIVSEKWSRANGQADAGAIPQAAASLPANGTGPYRVVHYRAGESARFVVNKVWWGWQASDTSFEKVVLHTVGDAHVRTSALLSGQVDLIAPASVQDLDWIDKRREFKTVTGPELRTIFLNMDQMRDELVGAPAGTANPLRDKRVRMALHHAIDAASIVRVIMRERAVVATSLVSPLAHIGVRNIQRLPYSPQRAKQLLSEAGYGAGFELPMDCPADRYINDGAICEAIAGMLRRIGVRVHLNVQPKGLFFSKVLSGGGYNSAFNLIGWTPSTVDGLNVLANVAGCRDAKGNGARFNLGGYCNVQVDELVAGARVENDLARRDAMITRAFRVIHEDAGFIPLHQQMLAWAMSEKIDAQVRADNQIRFRLIRPHGAEAQAMQ